MKLDRTALGVALLLAVLALLAGCGGSGGAGPTDQALNCIEEAGLPAEKTSTYRIQVGRPGVGPSVQLFRTVAGAESAEVSDAAPGAEQIGRALIHVNRASDAQLLEVERCLEEMAG